VKPRQLYQVAEDIEKRSGPKPLRTICVKCGKKEFVELPVELARKIQMRCTCGGRRYLAMDNGN
jgi:DNA-directed RNA polymerase subunit RPC12/RpoP